MDTIYEYSTFYYEFVAKQWNGMTPTKYGYLMIAIGVFGWILMKNGANR